ncbi:monovalent cation/H(+) antiporter subunit G [Engelhardtia mirabilis]|uniref:Na(+)/H(+) antiporter subunit G n=1 Tax=Engelhardtia mirabilis TaxID=2528011 RepID=A0A518BF48_9BACT|nr:Na(+)/H(+) antiporter subunit G [Planctomycetes bacterium Pla133]QDU99907.1 Na(+)/H(+) antiporter subunit G [Planctomycetes bacterium Pla86]
MAWSEVLTVVLLVPGAALMLIGAIGAIRLQDTYLRMSATSKAATLGVVLMLAAGAVHFGDMGTSTRAVATMLFMLLTAPVAAHMIGRAAYLAGEPLWVGTRTDDLKGMYEEDSLELASPEQRVPDPTVPDASARVAEKG